MVFFHYCVLSNYFWLFIEGLYLFTLLVETFFPEKRYFYWYIIIGWGEAAGLRDAGFHLHSYDRMNLRDRNADLVRNHLGGAEAAF